MQHKAIPRPDLTEWNKWFAMRTLKVDAVTTDRQLNVDGANSLAIRLPDSDGDDNSPRVVPGASSVEYLHNRCRVDATNEDGLRR